MSICYIRYIYFGKCLHYHKVNYRPSFRDNDVSMKFNSRQQNIGN